MSNKLDLFTPQDIVVAESFCINGTTITLADALDAIDVVLNRLQEIGEDSECISIVHSFVGLHIISGVALAKLLFGWLAWWVGHDGDRDSFIDHSVQTTGIGRTTIERYTQAWARLHVENIIPAEFKEEIHSRPMKDQIAIANALSQGYVIEDDDWRKLARAANNSQVLAIMREATGRPPRSTAMTLFLERDGTLNGWSPSGICFVGFLNIKDEADEIVGKAIKRIIDGAGIIRR